VNIIKLVIKELRAVYDFCLISALPEFKVLDYLYLLIGLMNCLSGDKRLRGTYREIRASGEYDITHLDIPKEAQGRISTEYYEAGHMMYLHEPSLIKFKNDLETFIKDTAGL
jgi:hypothetical protein